MTAWLRRLKYHRAEPRLEPGLWLLPAVLLMTGVWVLALAFLGGIR